MILVSLLPNIIFEKNLCSVHRVAPWRWQDMTKPMITFYNFVNKPKIAHKSFTFTMVMSQMFPPSTLKRSNNYSGTLPLGDMTDTVFLQKSVTRSLDKASNAVWILKSLMKLGPTFNEMFSTVSASESWNELMLPRMLHVQHTRPAGKGLKQCGMSGKACATHHIGLMLSQLTSHTRDTSCKQLT